MGQSLGKHEKPNTTSLTDVAADVLIFPWNAKCTFHCETLIKYFFEKLLYLQVSWQAFDV